MTRNKDKLGRLVTNGAKLLGHEIDTIGFLRRMLHEDVEVIPPSHTLGVKTADFWMAGIQWEMKSPQGSDLRTIEHAFKNAAKQSANIIIDLRRTKIRTEVSIGLLQKHFKLSRQVRRMKLITLEGEMVDFRKK